MSHTCRVLRNTDGRHREPGRKRAAHGDRSDGQTEIWQEESRTGGESTTSPTAAGHGEAQAKPEAKPRLPRAD